MLCPACSHDLIAVNAEGLIVDVCGNGCGGIWFDNFELEKVDQAQERLGDLLATMEFDPNVTVITEKRPCPRCFGIVMMQHRFSPEKPVLVDECPSCGGMWLDGGELGEIRRQAATSEDRKRAAQRFFDRIFLEDLARIKMRRADRRAS